MRDYSKSKLPAVINPPDYSTLLNWWESWPEARPELLDFWGRGNYTRRLLSRKKLGRSGCIVRVNYVDEIESSLRRLALLDIDVDYARHGTTIGPQLTLLPQDINYEDSGGWGYLVAAGDKFSENRSGKEWCPSIGFAALLPDTATDWLNSNAIDYIKEGKIIVCPAINIGLEEKIGYRSEEYIQKLSDSASIIREMAKLKTLFSIELPYIEPTFRRLEIGVFVFLLLRDMEVYVRRKLFSVVGLAVAVSQPLSDLAFLEWRSFS